MTTHDAGWEPLADEMASQVDAYFHALEEVACGDAAEAALPLLLLATGQLCAAGARLGALMDVVPDERFEPDTDNDPDLDRIREALRTMLGGLDDYCDLSDPVLSGEVVEGSLADDLVSIAADLAHGRLHHREGRPTEAMWWWQFSYLSSWGERAAAALRVLLALLSHVRLDADDETMMEAELEALHRS